MLISKQVVLKATLASIFGFVGAFALSAQVNFLDPTIWQAATVLNSKYLKVSEGVSLQGEALKLDGYYMEPIDGSRKGKDAQYILDPKVENAVDKEVVIEGQLDGELYPDPERSFIAFVHRADSSDTLFKSQPCYAIRFLGSYMEVEKYNRGTSNFLPQNYASYPKLGFTVLPKKTPLKFSTTVRQEGASVRIIVKLNDIELYNALDNRNGVTVKAKPESRFMVGLIGTNRETPGTVQAGSSFLITKFEVK